MSKIGSYLHRKSWWYRSFCCFLWGWIWKAWLQ